MDLHHDDRFNRPAGCFTSPGNDRGGHDRCCPGYPLLDRQVSLLFLFVPKCKWWGMVVVRHWSLPARLKMAGLQSAGRGIPREIVTGAVTRLLEACWPPVKLVEPAGYAPASAVCKTAVLLLNEGPL